MNDQLSFKMGHLFCATCVFFQRVCFRYIYMTLVCVGTI